MAFADQVVVITGASSGIGLELARAFGRQRAKVGVLARRQEKLEALVAELKAAGTQAAFAAADVADRGQTLAAIGELRDQLGPIDLLIANSGIGLPTKFEPPNGSDVDYMVRVNYLGVIYAIEAVLPEMLQRGRGHLAAVSSLAGYKALPSESGYCSSKAAINAYLEGIRIQYRKRGIAVTTICPGFIKTPMTDVMPNPMPWLMSAEEAARRIVRALERKKKVFNFPWQTTLLMKSTRWLPDWALEWFLRDMTGDRKA